jgi:CBS domain-containing protein
MKLAEIMSPDPEWIRPETSVEDAACKMRELDTGFILIGDGDRLQGILTDRDIAIRAVAEGLDTATTPVEDVMTPTVIYCFDDQDVRKAADLMAEKQVRRLVVLNREKKLTGIVSLGDICVRCGDNEMAGDTLEDISQSRVLAF